MAFPSDSAGSGSGGFGFFGRQAAGVFSGFANPMGNFSEVMERIRETMASAAANNKSVADAIGERMAAGSLGISEANMFVAGVSSDVSPTSLAKNSVMSSYLGEANTAVVAFRQGNMANPDSIAAVRSVVAGNLHSDNRHQGHAHQKGDSPVSGSGLDTSHVRAK